MAKFRNQTETVDAFQLKHPSRVDAGEGEQDVPAGTWCVTHSSGRKSLCDPDTFRILYAPLSEECRG